MLREYLLIGRGERQVEHHRRLVTGQWLLAELRDGAVEPQAVGGSLARDEIYDKRDLLDEPPEQAGGVP